MRVWIHGAFSSPTSFNYFRTQMLMDDDIMIEYDWNGDLCQTINKIRRYIESKTDEPVDLIGHSLGGVICLILYHTGLKVRTINTLCAPYGGLEHNFILKWWFPNTVYSEIHKLQRSYNQFLEVPIEKPHQMFVATSGSNPILFGKPNDGVVTVQSQMALKKANYIMVDSNHYEILMNTDVVDSVKSFLRKNRAARKKIGKDV